MDTSVLRELNGGDDETEAVRLALILSMGEIDKGDHVDRTSDLDSEGTSRVDGDLSSPNKKDGATPEVGEVVSVPSNSRNSIAVDRGLFSPSVEPPLSLRSFDRKAMETERITRRQAQLELQERQERVRVVEATSRRRPQEQQKRKPQELQGDLRSLKRPATGKYIIIDDDDSASCRSTSLVAQKQKVDGLGRTKLAATVPSQTSTPTVVRSTTSSYVKGVVKKTWVKNQPRKGDDITIEEIWQKDDLELAVLSSFQWDEIWMMAQLNLQRTKVLLVAYATDANQKKSMQDNVAGYNIRFCFPPMPMNGCMHSKLQLLQFKTHIRIAIPTGNLVPYDWGQTGDIENMVFLIDLPLLPENRQNENNITLTPFYEDLVSFLRAQTILESLITSLRKYDFSETRRYGFVHSIPGSHLDNAFGCTGYSGLGRVVRSLGLNTLAPVQIDYVCSSLGSIRDSLLTALYYACQGDTGLKEYEERTKKARSGGVVKRTNASTSSSLEPRLNKPRTHVRLYFPSEDTVTNSRGGKNHAGTVCFREKWWSAPTFPREVLRDVQNVRHGVLLHTKLLLVRPYYGVQGNSNGPAEVLGGSPAWAYVGSANMSESAWGRIVKDQSLGKPKMTCRNWECGVVIPIEPSSPESMPPHANVEDSTMLHVFRDTIPIPFIVPGDNFIAKRPWFFMGV